jgi:predicted lipid-binding transport protein (Tim44 family)
VKHLLVALCMAVGAAGASFAPFDAEAKRLGGGKSAGMQRQMPDKPAGANNTATPAQTPGTQPGTQPGMAAATAGAAAPAAAAAANAGKRSWMGPLAGLAAGIGLAALASHLGFGDELANFMMIALLAIVALVAVRFIMARMRGGAQRNGAGPQLAGAGAGAGGFGGSTPLGGFGQQQPQTMARTAEQPSAVPPVAGAGLWGATNAAAAAPRQLPGGMDEAEFTRIAKQVFIRMQAANDAADVDDLRRFTTPELFASLKADLLERGSAKQQTDVVQLDAAVADVSKEPGRDIVSVRFSGLIREQQGATAEPFAELWHLVRDGGDAGDWAIAGISQLQQ